MGAYQNISIIDITLMEGKYIDNSVKFAITNVDEIARLWKDEWQQDGLELRFN